MDQRFYINDLWLWSIKYYYYYFCSEGRDERGTSCGRKQFWEGGLWWGEDNHTSTDRDIGRRRCEPNSNPDIGAKCNAPSNFKDVKIGGNSGILNTSISVCISLGTDLEKSI